MKNFNINKNSTQSGRKERPECSADMKLFSDDVYKSGTRGKKQQVDALQYGRSMIEMLGVLAIVGVLSVGGIAGYSKAMMKFKINKIADQVSQIATNIRTLYAQQTTYYGLNTVNAIKMGVTPDELGTGTTLTHAFGREVIINVSWSYNNPNNHHTFYIGYNGLPKEACISLGTMDWGNPSSSGLVAIGMGQISGGQFGDKQANSPCAADEGCGADFVPVPVAQAASFCDCPNNDCQVTWKFQ